MNKMKEKKNSYGYDDLSQLFRIYNFMVREDLSELNWEEEDFRIIIKREFGSGVSFRRYGKESRSTVLGEEIASPAKQTEENAVTINSPIVGVFYSSPAPGAQPFVEKGDIVPAGNTVCIVEAMKLMNEIQTETKCKILEILASNGQSVQVDEPLFLVLPMTD